MKSKNLKIAIRIPNWIGDAVLSTPFLFFTRKYFPKSRIYLIMRKKVKEVFTNNPYYNKIITINDKKQGLLSAMKEGFKLKKYKFDIFFILPDSFSSAFNAFFSRAKLRVGYKNECRDFLLNFRLKKPDVVIHRRYKYLNLLKEVLVKYFNYEHIPIEDDLKKNIKASIFLTKEEIKHAKEILKNIKGKKIGINPNASAASRRWFKERFAQLADKIISELKLNVIFFGSIDEKNYVKEILNMMKYRAIDMSGKLSLREYITILKHLDLFITNDSGPMHLANAVGTPVIAIEGAADIKETGMFNDGIKIYIYKNLPCSPCVKNVCPYNFKCLDAIKVSDVFNAVKKFLCM